MAAPAKGGTTLSGTVTAAAIETSECDWSLSKSVNRSSVTIPNAGTERLTYSLTACRTLKTSPDTFKVAGQVCVQNGGGAATEKLQIQAVLQFKTGSGKYQNLGTPFTVDVGSNPILDPGESECYPYESAEITRTAGASYRLVALITIDNHSGSIGKAKGPSPAADFPVTLVDATATVVDVPGSCAGFLVSGGLASWSIRESDLNKQGCATRSFTVDVTSNAGCGASCSLINTATLTETNTSQQQTAMATVTLSSTGSAQLLQQCLSRSQIVAAIVDVPSLKSELFNLINGYRAGLTLPPLQRVQILEDVAQSHSRNMSCIGLLSHDINGSPEDRIYGVGYDDQAGVGETIAQGQATPQAVLKAWQDSSAHNTVLTTAALTQVGLGLQTSVSATGEVTLWWTADFGTSSIAYSPAVPGTSIDRESAATELIGLLQAADAAYCRGDRDQNTPGHFGPIFVEFANRFHQLGLTSDCNLKQRTFNCLNAVLAGLTFPTQQEFTYTGYMIELWGIAG